MNCPDQCMDCLTNDYTNCYGECKEGSVFFELNEEYHTGYCGINYFYKTYLGCSPLCETCTGTEPTDCTSCLTDSIVKTEEDNSCSCIGSYYQTDDIPAECLGKIL